MPPQSFANSYILTTRDQPKATSNSQTFPQLNVVIHGLANLFTTSVSELASVGSGLQQYAQYYGLVISFDWPSYDTIDSFWPPNYAPLPYSFPPSTTSGTIRGNINGSVQAFGTILEMLDQLRQK